MTGFEFAELTAEVIKLLVAFFIGWRLGDALLKRGKE